MCIYTSNKLYYIKKKRMKGLTNNASSIVIVIIIWVGYTLYLKVSQSYPNVCIYIFLLPSQKKSYCQIDLIFPQQLLSLFQFPSFIYTHKYFPFQTKIFLHCKLQKKKSA